MILPKGRHLLHAPLHTHQLLQHHAGPSRSLPLPVPDFHPFVADFPPGLRFRDAPLSFFPIPTLFVLPDARFVFMLYTTMAEEMAVFVLGLFSHYDGMLRVRLTDTSNFWTWNINTT